VRETVYNLYVILEEEFICALGVTPHVRSGPDGEKLRFLQENVRSDYEAARTFPVPARYETAVMGSDKTKVAGTITFEKYLRLSSDGQQLDIFEELFRSIGAPPDPLVCITPVVDGVPRVDGVVGFGIGPLT
jgi:hypothetical protein